MLQGQERQLKLMLAYRQGIRKKKLLDMFYLGVLGFSFSSYVPCMCIIAYCIISLQLFQFCFMYLLVVSVNICFISVTVPGSG